MTVFLYSQRRVGRPPAADQGIDSSGGESCWGDSVMKEVEEEEEGGGQWAPCLGSVVGA